MRFYRKKPIEVEAVQWNPAIEQYIDTILNWIGSDNYFIADTGQLSVLTLEGPLTVSDDDWIIKGIKGEFYPCKPDIFTATYEISRGGGRMTYDSRPETQQHIARVQHFMRQARINLTQRLDAHDQSKLVEPELSAFDIATPKLAGLEYGSEEYKQSLRDLGPALQHHFEHNDHHPEHYEYGVRSMSLMALIEMLCDWRAASERVKQRTDDPDKVKTFESGLVHNQERFGYSNELAEILLNTAKELGML